MRKSFACCTNHLPRAVRHMAGTTARIIEVKKPDSRYTCECMRPANWFLSEVKSVDIGTNTGVST